MSDYLFNNYSTSVIQVYTDALIANLGLRPNLAGVIISDGLPPSSYMQAESWITLGNVHGSQAWAAIANDRRPKNETFTIDCLIDVVQPTVPNSLLHQPVLNRMAMALFAEVELELRGNPNQGVGPQSGINPAGYVFSSEILTPLNLIKTQSDTAREAALFFGIQVKARL